MDAMKCWFCGIVPTKLPHMCLLDKRNAEDDRMLALAFREAEQKAERDENRRAVYGLYARLVNTEARLQAAESRVGYMEYQASKAAR